MAALCLASHPPEICVDGGTASGVMAAVTAVKQGRTAGTNEVILLRTGFTKLLEVAKRDE